MPNLVVRDFHAQPDLPERVTVALAELAGATRQGLLAVGPGLQVLEAMLEEDVARLVGPKGRHNPLTGPRSATAPSRAR